MTAPLRMSFDVACPVERAFTVWTAGIGTWWPADHTVTGAAGLVIVLQGTVGGRIYERTPDGAEHDWGEVTVWKPPTQLGYLWHLRRDRADATEVDIRFIAQGDAAAGNGWAPPPGTGVTGTGRAGRRCCRTSRRPQPERRSSRMRQ